MRCITYTLLLTLSLLNACPQTSNDDTSERSTVGAVADKQPTVRSEPLIIWAEPLLRGPLQAIDEQFRQLYKPGLTPVFIERGDLLSRLEGEGPPSLPDVFLIADIEVFTALREGDYIDEASARTFAGDSLVLVQLKDRGYKTGSLFDIYRLRFKALGLGSPGTTTGRYAAQAMITDGCFERVSDRLERYEQSGAILEALLAEEVQLAVTTASQAAQTPGIEIMYIIGEDLHEDIRYQAVASKGNAADATVEQLLILLAENDEMQTLLTGYGLVERRIALKDTL